MRAATSLQSPRFHPPDPLHALTTPAQNPFYRWGRDPPNARDHRLRLSARNATERGYVNDILRGCPHAGEEEVVLLIACEVEVGRTDASAVNEDRAVRDRIMGREGIPLVHHRLETAHRNGESRFTRPGRRILGLKS